MVLLLHRVSALWPLERSFVLRCVSVHLFLDRQCAVVYHHIRMQCVVLADKCLVEPEGTLMMHKG